MCGLKTRATEKSATARPQKHRPAYGPVSSGGEPPAWMLADVPQDAAGERGQSPCDCDFENRNFSRSNPPERPGDPDVPLRPEGSPFEITPSTVSPLSSPRVASTQ